MEEGKIRVSKSKLFTGITMFMIAVYLFQIDSLLGNNVYQVFIKVPFFIAALYLFINIRAFRFNSVVSFLLLYSVSTFISNCITAEINLNIIMSLSIQVFLFLSVTVAARRGCLRAAVQGLFLYFLIVCFINDLMWVANGFQPLVEGNLKLSILPQFFVGNKFSVMYYHITLSALFLVLYKGRRRRNLIILFGIVLIILSFAFDCATTAVGSFAFMIMLLMEGKRKSLLESKLTIAIALAASAIFPFISEKIMNIGFIQRIVVSLLGRNVSITGRVGIFSHIESLVKTNPFFGVGRLNVTSVITAASSAANIQNGLWQIAITYGIIGATLLICVVMSCVRPIYKSTQSIHGYTVLVLIYTFIFIGVVEITYGSILLLPVAIYSALYERKRSV